MKPPFDRLMQQVLQLTRSGRLQDATAAIQAALRQPGTAAAERPAADADVVDIEARVLDEAQVADRARPGPAAEPMPAAAESGTAQTHQAAQAAQSAQPAQPPMPPPAPPSTPRPHEAPAPAAASTAAAPEPGRFISGSHATRHGSRAYKLFIPAGARHEAGRPLALVVMLHGCTQNPDDFAAGTRMNDAARRDGFYVLYPEQSREHNPQGCWNWFKHSHQSRERGEPAILVSMVQAVMAQHGIDAQRVYVAGLSAGGAMAAILGHTHPDLFAAVGVHSGLAAGAARDMPSAFAAMQGRGAGPSRGERPPPTIVFHGDEDRTVHPVNAERVLDGVAAHSVQALAGQQGLRFTRHLHRDEDGQVLAEHWVVHGAGHAWSGGSTQGSYVDGRGPDATQEMLRFFAQHRLAQPQPA